MPHSEPTPVFLRVNDIQKTRTRPAVPASGVGLYGAPSEVEFIIEGYPALNITLAPETTIGRRGASVDLSAYHASAKGVSRLHAVIRSHGNILTLTDLNSTNGTILNGEPLVPGKQRIIKSNDEIQMGRLVMRVQFDR
ncbi:MAG: FHA domain-containing protein [Anaerolineae bacterium]|nr:FHA domain-containing protein [Anaerolineae bacterium]